MTTPCFWQSWLRRLGRYGLWFAAVVLIGSWSALDVVWVSPMVGP